MLNQPSARSNDPSMDRDGTRDTTPSATPTARNVSRVVTCERLAHMGTHRACSRVEPFHAHFAKRRSLTPLHPADRGEEDPTMNFRALAVSFSALAMFGAVVLAGLRSGTIARGGKVKVLDHIGRSLCGGDG